VKKSNPPVSPFSSCELRQADDQGVDPQWQSQVEAQRERKWQRLVPFEVEGKTLGIVGLGTVGDALSRGNRCRKTLSCGICRM